MGFTEEEDHTGRLNEELSVWSVMNCVTVIKGPKEINEGCCQI